MTRQQSARALIASGLLMIIPAIVNAQTLAKGPEEFNGATQLIVDLDLAVTTIDSIHAAVGTSTAAASIGVAGSYLINLAPGANLEATATAIGALPGVEGVAGNTSTNAPELLRRIYAWQSYAWTDGTPVPAASQYAAALVNLAEAHELSTGSGVIVAVLDTGVQLAPAPHVGLGGALIQGVDLVDGDWSPAETRNGIDDDGDGLIDEGIGHGTHIAGIVHEVAPLASILPVRILDDDGTGTIWNAAEGMYWAAQHGAKIINMSLGVQGSAKVLRNAVETVTAQGVLVVAAAGNDGLDRSTFPAAAPLAIAVGSVGSGDVVSSFSNFGRWVDVVAPGEDIHSTYAFPADSYSSNSGTSMATPWVAGEAALLLARNSTLTPAGLTVAITAGAHSIDTLNPTLVGSIGAGRIDIAASLRLV
jgi:subtilisin family serine protease